MNPETVNLIERPYQEIVDDILTAIVGGVVNEPIFFDVKEDRYPLSKEARDRDIRSIAGTLKGERHTFQKEIDFVLSGDGKAVVWQPSGSRPDDETTFYVDYVPRDSRSPLTDINVGSVNRTLSEAIGREIATVYEQINRAYLFGFIDTAEGKALDLVVAIILEIPRRTKEFATGLVTFFRDPASEGNIAITEGTLLSTVKGEAIFVTTQMRTLQRGQVRIDVPVRASEASKGEAGVVKAGAVTTLAQPIAGIARVTNFEATVLGAQDESDEELRARAKAVLRGLGKATLAALARAIFEGRARLLEVWDPNGPATKQSDAGTVTLLVESEPERFSSLRAAVEETRAAGVLATLVARYVFFKPRVLVRAARPLTGEGKVKLVGDIIQKMQEYVDPLTAGKPAEGQELLSAIKKAKDAKDPKIMDVMAWRSDVDRPAAEALIDALMSAIAVTPAADTAALREALNRVLTEAAPTAPTGRRTPDRGLVQGPAGQRATDAEIEAGNFRVVPPDDKWFVVLDVEPADIVLLES